MDKITSAKNPTIRALKEAGVRKVYTACLCIVPEY